MKPRLMALLVLACVTGGTAHAADPLVAAGGQLAAGNYTAVLATLDKLDARTAAEAQARFLRGAALAGSGRLEEAVRQFEQLIADYPQMPEAYNNLATLYARQGRLNEAKELLERALRTDARYTTIYENLSTVYVELARTSYAKALRLEDNASHAPRLQMLTAWAGQPVVVASRADAAPARAAPGMAVARPAPVAEPAQPSVVVAAAPVVERPTVVAAAKAPAASQPVPAAAPVTVEPTASAAQAPAVPQPAPAEATVEASVNAVPEAQRLAVINAMQGWAKAWSQQNLEAYLAYYDAEYAPEGSTREAWIAERRARLGRPAWIKIALEDIEVQAASAAEAEVTLTQRYAAPGYKDTTFKRLSLSLRDGNWMITGETNLKVTR